MTEVAITASNEAGALRSLIWASFASAYEYPCREMLEAIRYGDFAEALEQVLSAKDPGLVEGIDRAALRDAGSDDDALPVEHTRLFIAGTGGPACALEEGVHLRTSSEAMEETLRYYRHFGLSLPDDRQEPPDHLTTELEFLHFLAYQEARAVSEGEAVEGLQRAQRDFIERHLGAWVPVLHGKLVASQAMPFYVELTRLLERYLGAETHRLRQMVDAAGSLASVQSGT